MDTKISIVVPIYQVEKYIGNCMKSICEQNFKDFEVVLVSDGTKDRSIEIAEEILKLSGINYNIIKQQNKGVSAARNAGIRNSCGEWIICIDPDDIINENFLKILYETCVMKNVDVAAGNYQIVSESELFKIPKKIYMSTIIEQEKILRKFLIRDIKIISPAMLIRKELIIRNNLWYHEDIRFSEDQHFIWRLLLTIDKIAYNETPIYNYYIRENSTMTSSDIEKILTGYNGFIDFTSNLKDSEHNEVTKFILSRWVFGALRAATKIMNFEDFKVLAGKMDYKNHIRELLFFPDYKTKILSIILLINLKSFYLINNKL